MLCPLYKHSFIIKLHVDDRRPFLTAFFLILCFVTDSGNVNNDRGHVRIFDNSPSAAPSSIPSSGPTVQPTFSPIQHPIPVLPNVPASSTTPTDSTGGCCARLMNMATSMYKQASSFLTQTFSLGD